MGGYGAARMSEEDELHAVLLIPPQELSRYITEELSAAGNTIEAESRVVRVHVPDAVSTAPRAEELRRYDILLTGWRTPRLPEALAVPDGRRRYVCHCTGTMRDIVPREIVAGPEWTVTNWGSAISGFVSEMNLALLLAVARRIPESLSLLRSGNGWKTDMPPGSSLYGKRIGLYGYGLIAKEFHRLIEPFGMTVGVYDPFVDSRSLGNAQRVDSLSELFAESDIVSIHAGLTPETEGSVTRELLSLLPSDGIVINTARARIVSRTALEWAVKQTGLRFGLDVFHEEPLRSDSFLLASDNVVVTPHSAGVVGTDQYAAIWSVARRNIVRYADSRPLEFEITPDAFDRMT